jgi:nitrogen regulatory protein PII
VKEVKAYVRPHMTSRIVDSLVREGCSVFSILEVRGIARSTVSGLDFSVELGDRYEPMLKLEIICRDDHADRYAEIIRQAAHTGHEGDGLVFIESIESVTRISDGARGDRALEP